MNEKEDIFYWSIVYVFDCSLDERLQSASPLDHSLKEEAWSEEGGGTAGGEATLFFHQVPGILNYAALIVILSITNNELFFRKKETV